MTAIYDGRGFAGTIEVTAAGIKIPALVYGATAGATSRGKSITIGGFSFRRIASVPCTNI